jgi:hypothetical protein
VQEQQHRFHHVFIKCFKKNKNNNIKSEEEAKIKIKEDGEICINTHNWR